jgi:hypothetical protein
MPIVLTDSQILQLVGEPKRLPHDYRQLTQVKAKRGHKERQLDLRGDAGSEFSLILRQGIVNPLDFSVILAYRPTGSNQLFRLRRYNGRHWHTNQLEGQTFFGFHIHVATERYQASGLREDAYADQTSHYADYPSAIDCMMGGCGFVLPDSPQTDLF